MVGVGVLMLLVSWAMTWQLRRGQPPGRTGALVLVAMTFSGWIATLSGWYVTEIGRQPWLVTGVLDTASAAAAHGAPVLSLSLAAYLLLYAVLLVAYIGTLLYLARKANATPGDPARPEPVNTFSMQEA